MHNHAQHSVTVMISDKTAYLGQSEQAISKHLRGGYPKNYGIQKIPSHAPVTFEMGEQLMDLPQYSAITAVINLL